MSAFNVLRRMAFSIRSNKWIVFIFLVMFSVIGYYVYAMESAMKKQSQQSNSLEIESQREELRSKLEDAFPAKIEVALDNVVMEPGELAERRKLLNERRALRTKQVQEDAIKMRAERDSATKEQQDKTKQEMNASSETSNLQFRDTETFLTVKKNSLSVFSAFLDGNTVRILGYKLQSYKDKPKCQFILDQKASDELVEGTLVTIPEHHSRRFTACYVMCTIPPKIKGESILAVNITAHGATGSEVKGVVLPIQQSLDRLEKRTWKSEFTVCMAPIQNNYNNVTTFVEMMEFNRILGAGMFVFYNYSIGADLSRVLKHYQKKRIVKVIDWKIPLKVGGDDIQPDIHYFGQLIAHNDCVYRNRNHSKYVVIQDMDEFIVPVTKGVSTWKELVEERKKVDDTSVVFQFKNCFVRREWGAKPEDLAKFEFKDKISKYNSIVLGNVYRENTFYRYADRSKCIIDPNGVITIGIHNIWNKKGEIDRVPESEAFVHHYRNYKAYNDGKERVYYDGVLNKFGAKLITAMEKTLNELKL